MHAAARRPTHHVRHLVLVGDVDPAGEGVVLLPELAGRRQIARAGEDEFFRDALRLGLECFDEQTTDRPALGLGLGDARERIRERLAQVLEVDREAVNVKATTVEGMGFGGREEGAAALAIAAVTET